MRARATANQQLRERLIEVVEEPDPAAASRTGQWSTLQAANAAVIAPLMELWDEVAQHRAGVYDFWGRGNFERLLLNARRFPNSFNVTLEVRSLADVQRAVRLWALYADFLLLLWKGPTDNGLAIVPVPEDYEEPGGWGYAICAGDELVLEGSKRTWHPAMGYISIFPDDVAEFLATEAVSFVRSGRLIVVPATGAGCINPGHGPFEQLLAEAANAFPGVRWKGGGGSPIALLPHSPDAPLDRLFDLVEDETERLRKLRLLLLKRSRAISPVTELTTEERLLAMEIEDALRDFEKCREAMARKAGLARSEEPLVGRTARFRVGGQRVGDEEHSDSPFAPLFALQTLGYGWRVAGSHVPRFPGRFQPQEGDVVGAWLAPPTRGWIIPTVRGRSASSPASSVTEPPPCGPDSSASEL